MMIDSSYVREQLQTLMQTVTSVAITGHVRPDGDCIGSCLAFYHYLSENFNSDQSKTIDVFLDPMGESFEFLPGANQIKKERNKKEYDLMVSLDCGSLDRLGDSEALFHAAKKTINIDHHISNTQFADFNYVEADASSTCEVLCGIFEEEKISLDTASALYTGIVHDTGVFKHSNTSRKTMEMAGMLLSKGVDNSKIIDESFYQKTYVQNQILGRCLLESILVLDKKVIVSCINRHQMEFYQAKAYDLDGIIDQLRVTKGVEVAILIHETGIGEFKVSMRSNGEVDVSKIATFFGGGGHIKAAGCSMKGDSHDVINNLTLHIENQFHTLGIL